MGQPTMSANKCYPSEVYPGQDGNIYRVESVSGQNSWMMLQGMSLKSDIYHVSCSSEELNNFAYEESITNFQSCTPKKKGGKKK